MKVLLIILLGIKALALSAQENEIDSCVINVIAENVRNNICVSLKKKQDKKDDLIRLKEYFSTLDNSAYYTAFSFIKDFGISCDQIEEYSILESYESHEPFRYIYLVVKVRGGSYHVSKYDYNLDKGEYLGSMKRNYFSKMFEYISLNLHNHSGGTNYMLLIRFTNKKDLNIELETGVTLWTMNQLFLLENALFD